MQIAHRRITAASYKTTTDEPQRDLLAYRDEFPILQKKTFLNTCSLGALSKRSIGAVQEYLELWAEMGASAWYSLWVEKLAELRAAYGRVIGATPDRIALAPSISVAVSSIASALDFSTRKKVVTTNLDFPTVGHGFLAKGTQGVTVQIVNSPDRVSVPLEAFEEAIDDNTALVVTSHVYFTSGAIQDIKALAEIVHRRGALLLVDAYQGTGQLPTNVEDLGPDFYVSGSLKWLLGGPGSAFLYVSRQAAHLEPTIAGWWGMSNQFDFNIASLKWRDEATRYEMGTPAVAAVYASVGGLSIVEEIGTERIRERTMFLTEDLIARAIEAGFTPRVAPDPQRRTAIVLLNMDDPASAVRALAEQGIVTDYRPGAIRISPYFYNSVEENEIVIEALKRL